MDCKDFKNNIYPFIEKDVSEEIKNEMEMHMKQCSNCKKYYENKIMFEKILEDSFSAKQINFKSHKANIMNNIDKNRYNNIKIFKYKLLKYKKQIITIAVVLILTILFIPFTFQKLNDNTSNLSSNNKDNLSSKKENLNIADKRAMYKSSLGNNEAELQIEKRINNVQNKFSFTKKENVQEKIDFHTPWIVSFDKKNQLCINGRGEYSVEESIGVICIKNVENNKVYTYTMSNPETQFSPIKIFWYDNQNILVTVGLGYGTLSYGGDLYILNINTAKSERVIKSPELERIVEAKKDKDKLKLKVIVFKDKELNKYNTIDREISIHDLDIKQIIDKIDK